MNNKPGWFDKAKRLLNNETPGLMTKQLAERMKTPERIDILKDQLAIPASMAPCMRLQDAIERHAERNLIFKTWGGLGDQICAEPTLRYALEIFKDCEISLATEHPGLFAHLPFKQTFHIQKDEIPWENYYQFETIVPPTDFLWQFVSHMVTNCVDFPTLCALRSTLPIPSKVVKLSPPEPKREVYDLMFDKTAVYVHAGKHWPSKTFPKKWWDSVLRHLKGHGLTPYLIGADTDDNRGTVDVDTSGCVDLRNKLSIIESVWLLQKARVLLTNDSSPLHMAVTGSAWIGFIATCKHPDFIMHWRRDEKGNPAWAWRQENHGLGGIWDLIHHCPNSNQEITVDKVDPRTLQSWLPEPEAYAAWAFSKYQD